MSDNKQTPYGFVLPKTPTKEMQAPLVFADENGKILEELEKELEERNAENAQAECSSADDER